MVASPGIDIYRPINTENQRHEFFLVEFEDIIKLTDEAVLITMIQEYEQWTECYPGIVDLKTKIDEYEKIHYDALINNSNPSGVFVRSLDDYSNEANKLKYRPLLPIIKEFPLCYILKGLNSPLDIDQIKLDINTVKEYATYEYNSTMVFEESIKHLKNVGIIDKIVFFNNPFTKEMAKFCLKTFPTYIDLTVLADDGNLNTVLKSYPTATTVCCRSIEELYNIINENDKELITGKQFLVATLGINFTENKELKHMEFFNTLYENYGATISFIEMKTVDNI